MKRHYALSALSLALASLMGTAADAAPTVSRLTPPSEYFATNGASSSPMIARFVPGQRFDVQATVSPDAGQTITGVQFLIDGSPLSAATLTTTGLLATLSPGSVVATVRAVSNATPGVHTLTIVATQSDATQTTRDGKFEVVGITQTGRKAKNIIIMLGDGMGSQHRTAARIMMNGYAEGKAKAKLAMDTFPSTAMIMTASLDSIVTDSAPGMQNYVTGNKSANNQEGVWPDDTTAKFDNPRVEYMSEYLARTQGKKLGVVTTADVFDATPASMAVHTQDRGAGTGIVDQFLDDSNTTGLTVLMGGGRKWFLPNTAAGSARASSFDYTLPTDLSTAWGIAPGVVDPGRDLIADFQTAGFTYVSDKTSMDAASTPTKLLGLFAYSNMNVSLDKINGRRTASSVVNDYGFPDQPLLEEMTTKALNVLDANSPNGFVLMVEGASIDKQAHNMDSERFIHDTIEFDHAIAVAKAYADSHADTLVLVTADHECGGVSIIGASKLTDSALQSKIALGGTANVRDAVVGNYQDAKFPKYSLAADGYPITTDIDYRLLIGYGANADRYEDWRTNAQPLQDSQQPFVGSAPLNTYPANPLARDTAGGFLVTGQVFGTSAVHTGGDIPLSAYGRGSSLIGGTMDNTDVFFAVMQAAIGGATK